MRVSLPLPSLTMETQLPARTVVLAPLGAQPVADPETALAHALAHPIGAPPFDDLIGERLARRPGARAVVVVSDNTRPVPYTGEAGILWPLLERLLQVGYRSDDISVLVACGTHRPLTAEEIRGAFDARVFAAGIAVRCHDAFAESGLEYLGVTGGGRPVTIDREYLQADLRILTGLVESHLMAGASGGRKSICPGILGIDSIRDFHSAAVLADPRSTDLVLEGNPCNELALEIARMAPADFIVNVTVREDGATTGVFAGATEPAHRCAVDHLMSMATISVGERYDVVVTHAGKVGVNHYQAAKAASAAARAVKTGGHIILVADTPDPDPVGGPHYRALLADLVRMGPGAFNRLILGPDWDFVPDQWQVQVWARVLERISIENLLYFSPQTSPDDYALLPCRPWQRWMDDLPALDRADAITRFIDDAASTVLAEHEYRGGGTPSVAFLAAGPYGIPVEARP